MAPTVASAIDSRFRVVRVLHEEHDVQTLLVEERLSDVPCIVTVLSTASVGPDLPRRIAQDITRLERVSCPFLSALTHVRHADGVLSFARSFVPGVTLLARLRAGPLSLTETLDVADCLFEALARMHERGTLHRDVRPSNVVLVSAPPKLTAVLVCSGLAHCERTDLELRDLSPSMVRALSPEQAGLIEQQVSVASDLYSAGMLLYECLSGHSPLRATSARELLHEIVTATPAPLRRLGIDVPGALDELILRLVRKDPSERYGSATAVIGDLTAIRRAVEGEVDAPAVHGAHDARRTLATSGFIGRTRELGILETHLQRTREGAGGLVVVEALSGGGKSRLLDELALRAASRGGWVIRGQGIDHGAQRPFELLDGLARELVSVRRTRPVMADAIGARLGEHLQAIGDALPQLTSFFGAQAAMLLGPEGHAELRSLAAIAELLDALGSSDRPALILFDDAQWADEQTLRLFSYWLEHAARHPEPRNVLLVVSYRSEEVDEGHPLRALAASERIVLEPLGSSETRSLLESMAGPLPDGVVEAVLELSLGSPFMATAVVHGMVEAGALVPHRTGWRIDPEAMAEIQSSREAAAFLVRRLGRLPEEVLRLLSVGAVLGKEFELDLACTLAKQEKDQARSAVEQACARQILWRTGDGLSCVFVHDKLREALLSRLSGEEKKALHRLAATRIDLIERERTRDGASSMRVFEIAYHFDAAGEYESALPSALLAADGARARHAIAVAEQQYRIAERGAASADAPTRQRIAEGLGDVLMLRGRYDEATAQFELAYELAREDVPRAQIYAKLGEIDFKRGNVRGASDSLELGLRLLGRHVPRRKMEFFFLVVWELFVQALHTLLPKVFVARRSVGSARELLAIRLYSRLAYAYWFYRGTVACGWAHLREMNLAERYPPTSELAQAYSEHAPVTSMVGAFDRGLTYAKKSLEIRRSLGDIWGQGQSLNFEGTVLYAASRFSECIDACEDAVRLLARTGDRWEANTAAWQLALCAYRLGDLRLATERSQRAHAAALEIGDDISAGISLGIWSKASGGRVPARFIEGAREKRADDVHTTAEVCMAAAVRFLREERPADAVIALDEADAQIRAKGFRAEYVAPVPCWLATALRAQLEQTPTWNAPRRATILRRLARAVRRGLSLARRYENNLPHALRESAWLSAICASYPRSRAALDESLAVAARQGARYEHALSRLAWGQIGQEAGWPDALEVARKARSDLALFEAEVTEAQGIDAEPTRPVTTLSLADRFSNVVEAGHRIASALSNADVFEGVRDAALKLLRGDRFVAFDVSDGKISLAGDVDEPAERSFLECLVEHTLASGTAVLLPRADGGPLAERAMLAGIKSALCAPISVRGELAYGFCVTHHEVAGLFLEDEARLATYVATVAGTALENAAGFAALNAAHETLSFQKSLLESQNEASPDGVLVVKDRRVIYRNTRFGNMWDIPTSILADASDEAALAAVLDKVVSPAAFLAKVNHLYDHPDEESEDEILLKDGRTFDRFSAPMTTDRSEHFARVWNFRDVTARKQMEERLRTEYAITRVLAESATLAEAGATLLEEVCTRLGWEAGTLWTVDPRADRLQCRQVWREASVGLDTFELASRSSASVARGEAIIGRVWASGVAWAGDLKGVDFGRGVETRAAGLTGSLVIPLGKPTDDLGVIELFTTDLRRLAEPHLATAIAIGGLIGQSAFRRRAVEERNMLAYSRSLVERLRSSEMRLAEAQHIAHVGSWEWDIRRNRVFWSDEMYRIYGRDPHGPMGFASTLDEFIELAHPGDREHVRESFAKAWTERCAFQLEYQIVLDDGRARSLQVNAEVIVGEGGAPMRMVGTAQDISERKAIELMKNDFVSVVSHELRTPLTSIRGALGLLEGGVMGPIPPKALAIVEIARVNSDRLIRLVNDILDLDKIAAGKLELARVDLDPTDVVTASIAAIAGMAQAAGVTFRTAAMTADLVHADKDRVIQVLVNLASNAVKFSHRGDTVDIVVDAAPGDVGRLRFTLTDRGPGIAPDDAEQLFAKFQQVDASDSRSRGGTGLGLAICKAIVEAHGGAVGVDSTVGVGSSFWFELPRSASGAS